MNRRQLLSWFGLGWLVALLPASLVGCSPNSSDSGSKSDAKPDAADNSAVVGGKNFKPIGNAADLDKNGYLVSNQVGVVKDPSDKTKLLAVSTVCTHQGCDVKWKADKKLYVCPCHDAQFAADGKVVGGPAKTPLRKYAVKVEKGQVLVNI
jgi:cytochrome b6-f complex iron-sulfur subunit